MNSLRPFYLGGALIGSTAALVPGCAQAAPPAAPFTQRLLLSSLDAGANVQTGGWQMNGLAAKPASVTPKFGGSALTFSGLAGGAGSKGDFTVYGSVPGTLKKLSVWVHLAEDANISTLGLQLHDKEGESLIAQVPADWTGWKLVEFEPTDPAIKQAYPQNDKNKKVDLPLGGVHVIWFAKAAGPTSLTVDELAATTELGDPAPTPILVDIAGGAVGEPDQPFQSRAVLTNFTGTTVNPKLEYVIQRDSALYSKPAPDPVFGSDEAIGAKNWAEENGKKLDEGSLTDDKEWTAAEAPWGQHTEAVQYLDLGEAKRITRIIAGPSDANWAWKVDFSASTDGTNYQPVAGMQGLDWHAVWGSHVVPVPTPFTARYLKMRHHKDGEKVNAIRMPSSLSVYDGMADEKIETPKTGEIVTQGTATAGIPANGYAPLNFQSEKPLGPGAYLVALKLEMGGQTRQLLTHYFVMPPAAPTLNERLGFNAAEVGHAPLHRRMGIGWVRFENFKWQMISPEPKLFKFDGTVGPWHVNHDAIVEGYTSQGIQVLPFLFQTPEYATSAGKEIKKERWDSYPPKDNALMADFAFQSVARYGSVKHPANVLESPDKKSGLNKIHYYEIWNEPNLTDVNWGPWVGTTAQYLEMFRAAAEGVKKADPKAQVTNGGYAGIEVETVDPLRTYKYADGKRPLDFVDVLNVHYYSGRVAPEIATMDPNADRSGNTAGALTYEETLHRLVAWRNQHKPGLPIWLTETGYDSTGPFGTTEVVQAARLPRVVMMALAAGMDKVFVYRESGSTPSMHAASGVLRNDGSLKPSWFTYATLVRQMNGVQNGLHLPHPDANVQLYRWTKASGPSVSAWTVEGDGKLNVEFGPCTVTDAFGHESTVQSTKGITLTTYPVYLNKITNVAALKQLEDQHKKNELARQQEKLRQTKLRAYLYDFGSTEQLGTVEIGNSRTFTAVLAKDVFDETRGFGFSPKAAYSDNVENWVKEPLEREHVRFEKGVQFRMAPAPGKYKLRISAMPFGTSARLTLKGVTGGDRILVLEKGEQLAPVEIQVGTEPVSIEPDSLIGLKWLSLVQAD